MYYICYIQYTYIYIHIHIHTYIHIIYVNYCFYAIFLGETYSDQHPAVTRWNYVNWPRQCEQTSSKEIGPQRGSNPRLTKDTSLPGCGSNRLSYATQLIDQSSNKRYKPTSPLPVSPSISALMFLDETLYILGEFGQKGPTSIIYMLYTIYIHIYTYTYTYIYTYYIC